jgi:predicted nucleic acid-binding protein
LAELVFLDANVIIYALGRDSPHRSQAMGFIEAIGRGEVAACTDSEVLQEILHRFRGDRPRGLQAFDWMRGLVDVVYPVTLEDMMRMRRLFEEYPQPSTRDLVHIAVMQHHDIKKIASYDQHFDAVPLVQRIQP